MSSTVPPPEAYPQRALPDDYECHEGVYGLIEPFPLHFGGQLDGVDIAFRLAGRAGAPVVAALGGISSGRQVFAAHSDETGWWEEIAGPGRALDTDRFRVLGFDFLGGSHRSTGPGRGETFPSVSAYDQASVLALLMDHLGIKRLQASVGASYGGMVTLAFAHHFPERLRHAVMISAAHRTHPMSTAWRSVQRAIVRYAISREEGAEGLKLARALAMATYRSAREFEERFPGVAEREDGVFRFPVESYLFARGASYASHYRPEAFICLSESIDLHRVEPEQVKVPVTCLGIAEDQLVPLADMRELRDRLGGGCQLIEIDSIYGHDAFLKEKEVMRDLFAQALA